MAGRALVRRLDIFVIDGKRVWGFWVSPAHERGQMCRFLPFHVRLNEAFGDAVEHQLR